ncbi:MAG: LAGLIDADG family homing endonuclease [bacterium]|nr:LAGLIDADG family homing endonuclease [bacterium]
MKEKISKKQLGYVVGVYYGDGYIYYDKKSRHYSIEFSLNSLKDLDILKFLKEILIKEGYNLFIKKDKRGNWFVIKMYSKQLYSYLKEYKLQNLKRETKDFKIGFISGVIDAEAYVGNSTIEVINTDLELLKITKQILNEINISSSLKKRVRSKKDTKDSFRLLVSTKIKKAKHISQKVLRLYPTK